MEKEELYVIEDFVEKFQTKINFLKDSVKLLDLNSTKAELTIETIDMLEKKLEKIKTAKNLKQLKKVLRVKTLLEDKLNG